MEYHLWQTDTHLSVDMLALDSCLVLCDLRDLVSVQIGSETLLGSLSHFVLLLPHVDCLGFAGGVDGDASALSLVCGLVASLRGALDG